MGEVQVGDGEMVLIPARPSIEHGTVEAWPPKQRLGRPWAGLCSEH